ncbi:MAG: biotin synthase BioB, partial [Gammaproteobacteria bacterium]
LFITGVLHLLGAGGARFAGFKPVAASLIAQLAKVTALPESVPINNLVPIKGMPLTGAAPLDPFEFVRTIAVARITMPRSMVRLSAGREQMDEALQALCFAAGANSIFYGDKLLTTRNPQAERDRRLFERLGLKAQCERPVTQSGQGD